MSLNSFTLFSLKWLTVLLSVVKSVLPVIPPSRFVDVPLRFVTFKSEKLFSMMLHLFELCDDF